MRRLLTIGLGLALASSGCIRSSVGPRTIPSARLDYNEAISRSWDEQLLLNVVRLRYRDNPLFVDISSVTASYSFGRTATLGGVIRERGNDDLSLGTGVSLGDNPVISYNYLSGAQFAQRLLSPIAAEDLRALAVSGWSIERLLRCCAQRVNERPNAITAAGPTPDRAPAFEEFQQLAALSRDLQADGLVGYERRNDGATLLFVDAAAGERGERFRALLGVPAGGVRYEVVNSARQRAPDQVATEGRSLLGVLYFLSHAVEVPEVHRRAGLVTITRDAQGAVFDWSRVVGDLMRIRSGTDRPTGAAVAVRQRDHWFWIADDDLESKSTLSLLRLLLFLKSGDPAASSPLVTIPIRP